MTRLMIIGAGLEQVPLIKTAKRLGHWVLATHPAAEGAEGFALADATAVVDPRNLPRVLEIAREHRIEAAVADQCDYSMYAVAFLGEQLGFPAIRLDQAQFVTNKLNMRNKVAAAGTALQPEYKPCVTFEEAQRAARSIGYPVIVKPVDNRGNFGVTKVDSEAELKDAWLQAIANSHSRIVLVEKFIEGLLTTVEGCFVARGVYKPLAVSWKKMLGGKKRVAMELVYDTKDIKDVVPELLRANDAVVRALGLDFGATHAEFIVTPEKKAYLVEIHNRGGGVHIFSKICPAVSGLDTNECLVRLACGEPAPADPQRDYFMSRGSAVLSFFQFGLGKVKDWQGTHLIEQDPRVLDFRMLVKKGEEIKPIIADVYRHAFVIVKGSDYQTCLATLQELKGRVTITYEERHG